MERAKWEKELQKREYEAEIDEAELERLQSDRMGMPMFPKYKAEMEWLQYGAELGWFQSDRMGIPMFPLSVRPQQLVPTAVALAAEAPAADVMTDTRVFPDTAAPYASVERAATKLTSAAGTPIKISGERRASTGTVFPLAVRYNNNSSSSSNNIISSSNGSNNNSSSISNSSSSSNSNSSSSNNDTTTTCAGALLRSFDPGKGCQRDTRRGKAVIGLDLPFDRGKA